MRPAARAGSPRGAGGAAGAPLPPGTPLAGQRAAGFSRPAPPPAPGCVCGFESPPPASAPRVRVPARAQARAVVQERLRQGRLAFLARCLPNALLSPPPARPGDSASADSGRAKSWSTLRSSLLQPLSPPKFVSGGPRGASDRPEPGLLTPFRTLRCDPEKQPR